MPESAFCSQRCWLESFLQSIDSEPPRFRLGEILVCESHSHESGEISIYRLQVVGLTASTPGWLRVPGWWYFCKFLPGSECEYLVGTGAVEEFHESELRRSE